MVTKIRRKTFVRLLSFKLPPPAKQLIPKKAHVFTLGRRNRVSGEKEEGTCAKKKMSSVLYKFDTGFNTVAQTSIKKHRHIIGLTRVKVAV